MVVGYLPRNTCLTSLARGLQNSHSRSKDWWIDQGIARVIGRDVTSVIVFQPLSIYYERTT